MSIEDMLKSFEKGFEQSVKPTWAEWQKMGV